MSTSSTIASVLSLLLARTAAPPPSEPATVDAALASGDLSAARSLAETTRKQAPTAEHWRAEAEVCERLADHACARTAWEGHLAALPASEDRKPGEAALARLEEASRGTVADEPASTHRAALDRARAEREAALLPKPAPADAPKPMPPRRERIVKKWYFWVTTLAIAAAAGAITGIAIKAARDEQPDVLDAKRALLPGGLGLRF